MSDQSDQLIVVAISALLSLPWFWLNTKTSSAVLKPVSFIMAVGLLGAATILMIAFVGQKAGML